MTSPYVFPGLEKNINNLKVGESVDWKFGVVTRTVERISETKYVINDTSGGWVQAMVNKSTLDKLISGKKSLLTLNWK